MYYKPPIYTISHILTGFLSVWFPILAILMITYQFLQLIFNVRFFIFTMEIKKDNSIKHTALKLLEFGFGYGLGLLFYYQDFLGL